MKKLNTRETFAGTRIDILNEAGDVLTSIDYLSFGANKMDAKLFAGQIVNAWNKVYGGDAKMNNALYDLEGRAAELRRSIELNDSSFTYGLDKKLENVEKEIDKIKKAQPDPRPEFDPTYIREDKAQPE